MAREKSSYDRPISVDMDRESLSRRASALEEVPTFVPPPGYPGIPVTRRVSTVSQSSRVMLENDDADDLEELVRNTSAVSKQRSRERRESHDNVFELPSFPRAAKPGPVSTIREVPSEFTTPQSTRPPSPVSGLVSGPQLPVEYETGTGQAYPDIGTIASFRGAIVLLCTCGAQLIDNVFMTGVNIALPAIQKDFEVKNGELQWLISAYTLTFGGFLLLAGVLADRFGRKLIFCSGMATLSVWTVANGFATSFIQLAIFRALQGIGAAMTVPSAVGIISNYFVTGDRTLGLTIFGAAGAVGFCLGLIFGGFLTSSLGWRYIFYIPTAVSGALGAIGWIFLPKDRIEGNSKPKLDFVGAGLSTAGLILLSFVLSSGGEYGWGKAFIIVLLVLSIALIVAFTYVEKKVSNPIMPLSLWKLQNFAALWIGGFVMYGGYQTTVYYTTLIAQEVNKLSAGETALRFLPMGATGFIFSLSMSRMLEVFNTKYLLILGMTICAIAPIPSALMKQDDLNFWKHVFPTTVMGVAGTTIVYCTITVVLLASLPVNVKSLCGGMINTAFQIGSGVGLALASAIVQAVDISKGHSQLQQFNTGLWCCVGLASVGVVASTFGVKNVGKVISGPAIAH
ncbi:major facilitator superfamily transporter [Colletotrichum graminicola M1.001]|uniref:Major facilitator superfamily transporter n=1 Tax=Colletotrichum graminicola (strain M1.001 / M2 / FGSC 10212) TaxID=645133 RepID=E3QJH9_COLGM|nr:major facilitator superfamily transporter [Colletotrichum graminicola M1.001]EFQ31017.1 major facilitator superfamily transporter [Colletotrichum graminicola M1.001]